MQPRVEIPKQHVPYFLKLLDLSAEKQAELLAGLMQAPPALYIKDLAENLTARVQIPEKDLHELLLMFAGMYEGARRSGDRNEFVDLVIDAAQAIDELKAKGPDWAQVKTLISTIVGLDGSLGVSAKALGVASDHEHVFQDSRILTDIRTVFSEDEVKPAAATIVHTIRLSFVDQGATGRGMRSVYLAIDSTDIDQLMEQLERAKAKEHHLKAMLKTVGLPVLGHGEDE